MFRGNEARMQCLMFPRAPIKQQSQAPSRFRSAIVVSHRFWLLRKSKKFRCSYCGALRCWSVQKPQARQTPNHGSFIVSAALCCRFKRCQICDWEVCEWRMDPCFLNVLSTVATSQDECPLPIWSLVCSLPIGQPCQRCVNFLK